MRISRRPYLAETSKYILVLCLKKRKAYSLCVLQDKSIMLEIAPLSLLVTPVKACAHPKYWKGVLLKFYAEMTKREYTLLFPISSY